MIILYERHFRIPSAMDVFDFRRLVDFELTLPFPQEILNRWEILLINRGVIAEFRSKKEQCVRVNVVLRVIGSGQNRT